MSTRTLLKVFSVVFLLSTASLFGDEPREPGIGCSQWNHFPITCENAYCIYDHETNRCLEDLGPTPPCHHYDNRPRFCLKIYHCGYDAHTGSCYLVQE